MIRAMDLMPSDAGAVISINGATGRYIASRPGRDRRVIILIEPEPDRTQGWEVQPEFLIRLDDHTLDRLITDPDRQGHIFAARNHDLTMRLLRDTQAQKDNE